jgi:hypothetical protein
MSTAAQIQSELKRISGTSTTTLTISPIVGYRHILYDFFVTSPPSGGYADIRVGTRVYMRVPFAVANCDTVNSPQIKPGGGGFLYTLLSMMKALNLLPNAGDDESINITLSSAATRIDAYYLETSGGDTASHTVEGGSDYPTKPFIDVFQGITTTTGSGQKILSESMPTGMNLLGTNGFISANTIFNMYLLAADYVSSGSNFTEYSRLHVWDDNEELFTPNNDEGLLVDWTIPAVDIPFSLKNGYYWLLKQPYTWQSNHLMNLLLDVPAVTGSGSQFNLWLMGVIQKTSSAPAAGAAPAGGA